MKTLKEFPAPLEYAGRRAHTQTKSCDISDLHSIESESLPCRMRGAVSLAWSLFSRKVGSGLVEINKEASMQLQFAYILQQLLPLITFQRNEQLRLELETGAKLGTTTCEMDVLLSGQSSMTKKHRIAIELKCYRARASSGGMRGATDIFMKDVYEDLAILERYLEGDLAEEGVALVMNDLERLVYPKSKEAKCWHYDISHGTTIKPVTLSTPIGGKDVLIELKRTYSLDWVQYGSFWFLEAQGKVAEAMHNDPLDRADAGSTY
jgi:hypothetical protein